MKYRIINTLLFLITLIRYIYSYHVLYRSSPSNTIFYWRESHETSCPQISFFSSICCQRCFYSHCRLLLSLAIVYPAVYCNYRAFKKLGTLISLYQNRHYPFCSRVITKLCLYLSVCMAYHSIV